MKPHSFLIQILNILLNLERIEDKDPHDYIIRYGNDQGEFSAGIYFSIHGEWLEIDLLIVDENERAAGLGSKLLKDAEALALEKNCSMSFLTTFGFQARPFYEKHGYSVVYEQKSYPRTGSKYFIPSILKPQTLAQQCPPYDGLVKYPGRR